MKRLRSLWQSLWGDADRRVRLGRILGLLFVTGGFVTIGFAWNGAAEVNFAQGQIPYLLSGGFMGLGLIITGSLLLLLSTIRSERELMSTRYDEMARLLGRNLNRMQISANGSSTNGHVIASEHHYHRAECKVLDGKDGLTTVTVEQASAEGLEPCRACNPPAPKREAQEASSN